MDVNDRIRRYRAGERGQALPLIVIMFIVLCGFVGLTIDVGFGMLQKRRLQAAVDLGLISGARDLPSASIAASQAQYYTRTNFSTSSDQAVTINTSTRCMVPGCATHDRIDLSASTETPTFFLRLFGIEDWNVRARGSACGPCDSSPVSYDVVVVLDRSGSMSNADMVDAREGIEELLSFFDPNSDRVGLSVLESADSNSPEWSSGAAPCETPNGSFTSTSYLNSAYTGYGGSAGAFMDGTPANHDEWLLVPLEDGTDFKNGDGTINDSSELVSTLECLDNRGSTPIGPAVQAATDELNANGREDAMKVLIYFGDGGASSMPLQRQCRQRANSSSPWGAWRACVSSDGGTNRQWRVNAAASWYTWSTGNRDRPCQDAIEQAQRATDLGIDVYTIGYGVSSDWCRPGMTNSPAEVPNIRQEDTIERMASDSDKFYSDTNRGDVQAIFAAIGHAVTAGGTRLVD